MLIFIASNSIRHRFGQTIFKCPAIANALPVVSKPMTTRMKTKKNIFLKSLYGLGFTVFLGVFIIARSEKSKSEFTKVSGRLISINNSNQFAPRQDTSKFRYLLIDSYPKIFEIFIGKDFGDFKSKFENIDNLRANDDITIYFDNNFQTEDDPINRLTYFIDKGQERIFVKGTWEKNMGIFLTGLSLLIFVALLILKQKGKIA